MTTSTISTASNVKTPPMTTCRWYPRSPSHSYHTPLRASCRSHSLLRAYRRPACDAKVRVVRLAKFATTISLSQKLAVCVGFCAIRPCFGLQRGTAQCGKLIKAKANSRLIGPQEHYATRLERVRDGAPSSSVVCRCLTRDTALGASASFAPLLVR